MHLQNTQHRHTGEVWMFSVWELMLMQTSPSPPLTCLQLSPACFCASVIDDGYFNAEQEHACEHKATFMESFFQSSVDQRSYTPESRSSDPTQSRQRPTEFVIAWKTLILLQLRLIDLNCFAVFREKIKVFLIWERTVLLVADEAFWALGGWDLNSGAQDSLREAAQS